MKTYKIRLASFLLMDKLTSRPQNCTKAGMETASKTLFKHRMHTRLQHCHYTPKDLYKGSEKNLPL